MACIELQARLELTLPGWAPPMGLSRTFGWPHGIAEPWKLALRVTSRNEDVIHDIEKWWIRSMIFFLLGTPASLYHGHL